MIIVLPLVPNETPTLNLYARTTDGAIPSGTPINGSPIAGTPVPSRSGQYSFNLGATPPGEYEVDVANPLAFFALKLTATDYTVADSWNVFEISSVNVTLSPQAFENIQDGTLTDEQALVFYNNEQRTITISLVSGTFDGDPMVFTIEDHTKATLAAITGLTSTTNSVVVTIPAIADQGSNRCLQWSLRKQSTNLRILSGPATQKYAAFNNV